MKKILTLFFVLILAGNSYAEITGWWGMISFRQRHETTKYYTDYTLAGDPGTLRYTDTNSKTRLGYRFGFNVDIADNLFARLTFRSGLGSVMWQDIDSFSGLLPGMQEAYIDWETPYARLMMGKIPQDGTAMWDLYAAANQTDWRRYDPTDGLFSDRMAALNGARLLVPVGPVTMRGTYHADYVGGVRRDYADTEQSDNNDLDWYAILLGINAKFAGIEFDGDYGLPYRFGDQEVQDDPDSVYVKENIWGVTLTKQFPGFYQSLVQVGYANNKRNGYFDADFLDAKASAEYLGIRLTGRYQRGVQESEYLTYKGSKAIRSAVHLFLNKTIWNLDIQPRIIWFTTEIDPRDVDLTGIQPEYWDRYKDVRKQRTNVRMEVTATVKF